MMQIHVDISDIRKRKSILGESSEMSNSIGISNAYEQAKKTDKFEDIRHFFQEAGSSRYGANEYCRACISFLEHDNNPELISLLKNNILPRMNDYEIGYLMESGINENLKDLVHTQIVKNKISDRIVSNHESITKEIDVDSIFDKNLNESTIVPAIYNLCSIIDKFNMPVYGKVNVALEESSYMIQLHTKLNFNPMKNIVEYFAISHDLTDKDREGIDKVIKENYVVEDIRLDIGNESNIKNITDLYISRETHNVFELKVVNDKIFNCTDIEWVKNISYYFSLLTKIIIYGGNEDIKNQLITDVIKPFVSRAFEKFGGSPNFKSVMNSIRVSCEESINTVTLKMRDNVSESNLNIMEKYIEALEEIKTEATNYQDISYTKENIEYMRSNLGVVTEASNMMTLYEYNARAYDPLLIKFGRFDKLLQREIRGWASNKVDTIKDKMKKIEDKMYEESIYNMIVNNHIDYIVDSYILNPEVSLDNIHKRATSIVSTFNETELKDTTLKAYYTLSENQIDFHIMDRVELLLSEDESIIASEAMGEELYDEMANTLYIADCLDENFDLFDKSTKFFIKNPTSGYFETFCNLCSMGGVLKEVVQDVYDFVKINTEDSGFVTENSYYINSYKEDINPNFTVAAESFMLLQAMLEADINDKDEDVEEKEKKKPNSRTKVKITPNSKTSKETPTSKTTKNTPTTKNTEMKSGSGNPYKGINLNNIKLYAAGLRKKAKDTGSRASSGIRDMDYAVERLIKGIKTALISDRRESIIKGSVIPSFHKCILIAVGLAGLAWFNLPLAIITAVGGFAASKKLTEKERALMLDDITIELELLDKEISMADSRNQIKKMRELMKMKKTLQREYQRIKYNIRIGKDIVPSTSYLPDNLINGG